MIVSQSRSTNPSKASASAAWVDAPASAFQIGRVTRRTRGARGDVQEGKHGKWKAAADR